MDYRKRLTFVSPSFTSSLVASRSVLQNRSCQKNRLPFTSCPAKPARVFQMSVGTGWADTRTRIKNETPIQAKPPLPGVYYEQPPKMTIDDLLKIIRAETPDEWVNEIVRTFLGWRQMENGEWNDDLVEPRWKEVYKKGPPDFIGKAGDYTPQKDRPIKIAIQNLSRSVPPEGKQLLKPTLRPYGFSGWRVEQLTPNLTRRAQAVNFILYWYKSHYPDYVWAQETETVPTSDSSA